MKNIAVIPARGGSQRLPGKNIRQLGEHPLLAHSILYAQKNAQLIDQVFVSTDDEEIAKVSRIYDAVVIERPERLSGDLEPTVSAVKHVLEQLDRGVESVILLQPTNPFRPEMLLKDAFDIYCENRSASLFTVTQSHQKLGRISKDKYLPFNYEPGQRSQDLEPLYYENGLLYISRREVILADKIISEDAFPMITSDLYCDVDIDTEADFRYAQYILSQL